VIGVPDPKWDQNVKALVILKQHRVLTAEEIIGHCRARIASYKKPKIVVFVDTLPRTQLGTIDRGACDAAHGGGGYPSFGVPPRRS
jgi:long-chain acyl-CoA synthetase